MQQVQGSGINLCSWAYGSMLSCCTCCTAVSIVRRKTLPLQAIRSRSAGGADQGRPSSALGLTVQARTAARILSAGFSMRSSSRPATVQVHLAPTHRADDLPACLPAWSSPALQIIPPVDLHLWHPFGRGSLRRATGGPSQPVHRPSKPSSKGRNGSDPCCRFRSGGFPWRVATGT